jgi:hypothetical protein
MRDAQSPARFVGRREASNRAAHDTKAGDRASAAALLTLVEEKLHPKANAERRAIATDALAERLIGACAAQSDRRLAERPDARQDDALSAADRLGVLDDRDAPARPSDRSAERGEIAGTGWNDGH